MAAKNFLLCFHDFSVWNYAKVMPILKTIRELAGRPFSVLVIPCTDGAAESVVAGFRNAIAELKAEGFELALHGYKHRAEFSQGRSYAGLVAMNLTGGEAEFAGLSEYESARLLQSGLGAWQKICSGKPVAFVPPTWYGNKFLKRQVRGEKMLFEDRFSLVNSSGVRYGSPVASFAGIPQCMESLSVSFAKMILQLPIGLPRLALHPVDFPKMESVIRELISIARKNGRMLVHYGDL